jgi:hypothetical protein
MMIRRKEFHMPGSKISFVATIKVKIRKMPFPFLLITAQKCQTYKNILIFFELLPYMILAFKFMWCSEAHKLAQRHVREY